jgi:hypothetical protein
VLHVQRFFRAVYADNERRRQNRRNIVKDVALYAVNRALTPWERVLTEVFRGDQPIAFIVGAPRSGTTLLFQLAARHLRVAYPTNAAARFWMAPLIGTMITRHRHRSDDRSIPLRSEFGGTSGPWSPHEFSWFWENHFWFREVDDLTETELDRIDWATIRRELEAIAGWAGAPLVLKSLNYTVYNIPRVARELPTARFVHIQRDPRFVVQSVLECRRARYGRDDVWWTIRPADVERALSMSPVDQVCHQIADIHRGIESGLAELPANRRLSLRYEDLVQDPKAQLERVGGFLGVDLVDVDVLERLALRSGNEPRMPDATLRDISARFEGRARV